MGVYDRDYYRPENTGFFSGRSMVANLILANIVLFVAELVIGQRVVVVGQRPVNWLVYWMQLSPDVIWQPWLWFKFVTYGFAHEPQNLAHIVYNMLGLWFFGRDIEALHGPKEFLRFYLTAVILSGLAFAATGVVSGSPAAVIGALGGVMAVLILFVMHYPNRQIYLMMIIPVPAWLAAVMFVLLDVSGFIGQTQGVPGMAEPDNTAHVAHLAGAAFGYLYYRTRWTFGKLLPNNFDFGRWRRRAKLRVHDPDNDERDLKTQVDAILEKISRSGEASLTRKERDTLERASRQYQRRRSL